MANVRAIAAKGIFRVIDKGESLSSVLPQLQSQVATKDKALLQELCFGVIRYLPELEYLVQQLMTTPLKGKQRVIHFLLLTGIYQYKYTRIPDHAAIGETVAACASLKANHLKKLLNGVLRNVQREHSKLFENVNIDAVKYNHPNWFIKQLKQSYPQQWQAILTENQQKPPMWLRVNQSKISLADYLKRLKQQQIRYETVTEQGAILLTQPIDVQKLPEFANGFVSVQDGAAQYAAHLLELAPQQTILDCCAAPGGKTCHILETVNNQAHVLALDVDEQRLKRVEENLTRLSLNADIIAADALQIEHWWQGKKFDRILLDAPCSATGVIRRHPDIKWLRKAADITALAELQQALLQKLWPLLADDGILLYATCSILPQENSEQIKYFVANTPDAQLIPLTTKQQYGWQLLPGEQNMDGFYYAKLAKKKNQQ